MSDFEELLDRTLVEMANPEPLAGFSERLMAKRMYSMEETTMNTNEFTLGSVGLEQDNLVASLWNHLRDLFFPVRLTLLVLESRPVPVADPLASPRGSRSLAGAVLAHAVILVLVGYLLAKKIAVTSPMKVSQIVALDAPPRKALPSAVAMGGGGGQGGPTPVTRGTPPKFAERQIVPPKAPPASEPKLAMEPTIEVQRNFKMASSVPQLGVANSPLVGLSMGNGRGSGLGSGDRSGLGAGSGGNAGGGPKRIGGGVSAPTLVYSVEPEFSEEARKAKAMGNVIVNLWVDESGRPSHVRVLRGVGMGLDEKALEAVRQYRFRPAMENGRPVTVELNVEVGFQIF